MSNKNLQNNAEDEILSVGDEKIQQMIKNLRRVDAPKNFDFRLKARIANAQPTDFQPRFLPALGYVLPLSVVLIFVVIGGVYFTGTTQTAEIVQPAAVERQIVTTNDSQIGQPNLAAIPVQTTPEMNLANPHLPTIQTRKREVITVEETRLVAVNQPKNPRIKLPKAVTENDESGGSLTNDYRPPIVITPRGIPSGDVVESSPNNENKNDIITKQILLPLGIEIISENGNRRVQSVKKESRAERAGVKVGDLVEAIDGEKVSGDAVRGKKLEGRQITVVRGTERVKIDLSNR